MASLSNAAGNRTVQFVGTDGKRRSLRLGKVPKKAAEAVKLKVEHLAAAAASRMPLDPDTAAWVASVGSVLAGKLAAVGLIPRREAATLGAFLADYVTRRRADSKGTTVANIDRVRIDLVTLFGAGVDVRAVTPAMADDMARHYAEKKLANATAARRLKVCRMVFGHAVRRGLADKNPFADIKGPPAGPDAARQYYASREDVRRVLAVCSPEWQVIVALSRFAGLRAPSEVLLLRWADVDLAAGRMVVRSPKTEHHVGGASRVVPIFPDLRPYLADAFDRAADGGAEYVVNGVGERGRARMLASPIGWTAVNLSVAFGKMVERAGLTPWPKIMHNMRASCETDLVQDHPIHVVCAWIGNTPKVALGHYLQTLDADFRKALAKPSTALPWGGAESGAVVVQNPVQSPAVPLGQDRPSAKEYAANPDVLTGSDLSRPIPTEHSDARDRT